MARIKLTKIIPELSCRYRPLILTPSPPPFRYAWQNSEYCCQHLPPSSNEWLRGQQLPHVYQWVTATLLSLSISPMTIELFVLLFFSVYHIHSEAWAFHKLHLTTVRMSKTAIDCDEMFTYTSTKYFCALKMDFFFGSAFISHVITSICSGGGGRSVAIVFTSASSFPPNPLVQ